MAKDSLAQQMLTGCLFFAPLQLKKRWNKSVSKIELIWNMWWSLTAWGMTVLWSYKLQSQFDNSNGMLPGQIFVRRERKLYVKLVLYLQDMVVVVVVWVGEGTIFGFIILKTDIFFMWQKEDNFMSNDALSVKRTCTNISLWDRVVTFYITIKWELKKKLNFLTNSGLFQLFSSWL